DLAVTAGKPGRMQVKRCGNFARSDGLSGFQPRQHVLQPCRCNGSFGNGNCAEKLFGRMLKLSFAHVGSSPACQELARQKTCSTAAPSTRAIQGAQADAWDPAGIEDQPERLKAPWEHLVRMAASR